MPDRLTVAELGREERPTLAQTSAVWARIGVLSFGGPMAQIALMHRALVEEKRWLGEQQFLNALGFCMLLPGPEAMQLAIFTGWRLHGLAGGLIAGLLFLLPGAVIVLALSAVYAALGSTPFIEAVFLGVKAAVLVIVIEALLRIARRALTGTGSIIITAVSFISIFFLALPFPLIVFTAALIGFIRKPSAQITASTPLKLELATIRQTIMTLSAWLAIWFVPLFAIAAIFGRDHILTQLGWFFSKLAVVTFGGAYAVLAYMGQDVVVKHGWLEAGQMMDGLGLAETTPGPLILVTEFVGFVAAWRAGGEAAWLMGLLGALTALWATFVPCFLWIFVGAPYVDWINAQPRLRGALSAITAAVVGVIFNLALWFALHVFFADVRLADLGIVKLWIPQLDTIDWRVVALACVSGFLLLRLHLSVAAVLAIAAAGALAVRFTGI